VRPLIAIALAIFLARAERADAEFFSRSARPGQATRMHTYLAWKKDCSPNVGIVRLVTKPQHGTLKTTRPNEVAARNRWRLTDPCIGKTMKGFRVEYTSVPGYRGPDSFVVEFTAGQRPTELDTFTVSVE